MSRNATTGIYTRVSNSFSQPVTGTTIDPADADTFFDDVEESMNSFIGTSTTSLTIGTGSRAFTTQTTKTFIAGMFVQAISQANSANYMYGTVTSYDAGTGVLTLDVVTTGGSGTLADWLLLTAGARGGTGATGPTGFTPGIRQAYSSTTSDSDPGAGTFRLNNATPASATAAYLDNVDSGGTTVSTLLDLFDDSTTTTKGYIRFEKSGDPTVWAQFAVTGSVVDGTGYRKLTLTNGAGSGSFTNADVFAITFYRSGDAGINGAVAVSGTPTVNQFTAWVDATTVKGVSITGLVKGNGVSAPTAASAGTDYYNPGGTDVAVADGGTGSSTASGARSNLSAAAQSQTAEFISGYIKTPANQTYLLVVEIPHAGTITQVDTKSESGTCTATFKVNTTALGGTANSVSSTQQGQAQASSNTFVAGDDINVTISSNSSCVGMSFTIKYTRTLL